MGVRAVTEPLYSDEAIIRSVTYSTRGGHKVSFELDPEGWERLKGMETTRCMMVLVPIQNDGQPDPDVKPADKPRKRWDDLTPTQQAGIRCSDVDFQAWLGCSNAEAAAVKVRAHCRVETRASLVIAPGAAALWRQMDHDFMTRLITRIMRG